MQAIEFWNTICEEEYDLITDADPEAPCHYFIKAAAPHVVPILLEQLTKQVGICRRSVKDDATVLLLL
jgi:importin subunit beta-1